MDQISRAFAHTYLADAFHSMGMPEKAFEEVEAFRHFMGLMKHLIAMGFYEEARKLLTLLEKRNAENNVLKRRIQICENWIRYYKATGEKELLQKYYRKYFELQKENEEKENQRVIQAIDNWYKLEYVGKEYNLADFIHVADRKLYEAKRQGKNRYILDCK